MCKYGSKYTENAVRILEIKLSLEALMNLAISPGHVCVCVIHVIFDAEYMHVRTHCHENN